MNDAAKQRLLHLQYRARRAAETADKLKKLVEITQGDLVQFGVEGWETALGKSLLCEVIRVGRTELIRQLTGELETFLTEPAPELVNQSQPQHS